MTARSTGDVRSSEPWGVGGPQRAAPSGVRGSLAWLTVIVACMAAGDWLWFARDAGEPALRGMAAAACGCWVSSSLALMVVAAAASTQHLVAGALAGMLVQLGIPLALLAWATQSPAGRASGAGERIVVYFLATLLAETTLAVMMLQRAFPLSLRPTKR